MSAHPKIPIRAAEWHPSIPDAAECQRRVDKLSPRQREVIDLLAHGWSMKQVARRLGITNKTTLGHIELAYRTLDVSGQLLATAVFRRAAFALTVVPDLEPVEPVELREAS